ncbi:MAG TPA: glucodextranase DOMON-like domain-containing protein [Limnochordales bacterium]
MLAGRPGGGRWAKRGRPTLRRRRSGRWPAISWAAIALGVGVAAVMLAAAAGIWDPGGRRQPDGVPTLADTAPAQQKTVFQMNDPVGDDRGPGGYRYPGHHTFVPGLFDLTSFAVRTGGHHVHFDLTFRAMVNPWDAPEGFHHQLIDIYIDTTPGAGHTGPLRPGPRVRFDPNHAWDVRLRVAPFGGTRLHRAGDGPDEPGWTDGLAAGLVADGRTIRASVPQDVLGTPQPSWRYYVLVGGFDPFGEDGYRPVRAVATEWSFGGGDDAGAVPQVIDLLAPRFWPNQARQLGSFTAPAGGPAVPALIHPVGGGRAAMAWATPVLGAAGLLFVMLGATAWWRRARLGSRR